MDDLREQYVLKVRLLLERLDADLLRVTSIPGEEWRRQFESLRRDIDRMPQMSLEELEAAIARQRPELARLGELYLRVSRNAEQ